MLAEYDGILYIKKRHVKQQQRGESCSTIKKLNQKGIVQILKDNGYWTPLINVIKFVIHFGVVIGVLFCGAWVFTKLEDPEKKLSDVYDNESRYSNYTILIHDLYRDTNRSTVWRDMQRKYNVKVEQEFRSEFLHDVKRILDEEENRKMFIQKQKLLADRDFIWMKWFYFTTICTTTIGYGDVSPETPNGKLFYIFFSIFGIATMMTLMKECGAVLTCANKKFYGLLSRYICGPDAAISQELLSVFSITFIFFCFMAGGIWYDTTKLRAGTDWTYVNVVYFWIVTFTTVGFDTPLQLQVELQHVYQLLVYRLFGLSFLAGIIDSLKVYVEYRKDLLKEKAREFSNIKAALLKSTLPNFNQVSDSASESDLHSPLHLEVLNNSKTKT